MRMDSYTSITVGKQLLGIGNKFREDMDEFLYVNYSGETTFGECERNLVELWRRIIFYAII